MALNNRTTRLARFALSMFLLGISGILAGGFFSDTAYLALGIIIIFLSFFSWLGYISLKK